MFKLLISFFLFILQPLNVANASFKIQHDDQFESIRTFSRVVKKEAKNKGIKEIKGLKKIEEVPSSKPLLTIKFGYKKWEVNLGDFGFDGIDPLTLNRDKFMTWFYSVVEKEVNSSPMSAFYKQRRIVPHKLGITVDRKKVEKWLDLINIYVNKTVDLPVNISYPKLTTDELMRLKEKRLSSYKTWFNPFNINRVYNIKLSSYAIDHVVVMPGEEFSFNKVVGKRTERKGYRLAKIIVQGEYGRGVGGGICQTSSTLFNSVDKAGLNILERSSHSKRVTYVPLYRDATVSWNGHDFRFHNNYSRPILIVADVNFDNIVVSIYGPSDLSYNPKYVEPAPMDKEAIKEVLNP